MSIDPNQANNYFQHLNKISLLGRIYKRFFTSPLLYLCARRFGSKFIEVGSGTGRGMLGAYPKCVTGIDINPLAVDYAKRRGLDAQLINENGSFPFPDESFDTCILDNVLEHIENPRTAIDECWRVTGRNGGLIIVVPGERGFDSDPDHKVSYDEEKLRTLDSRWVLIRLFAMPTVFLSKKLSRSIRQYCLVAVYKKAST